MRHADTADGLLSEPIFRSARGRGQGRGRTASHGRSRGRGASGAAGARGAGTVVATVLCGDDYVAEHPDTAVAEVLQLVAAQHPDLVVTGPAFLAGRFGKLNE